MSRKKSNKASVNFSQQLQIFQSQFRNLNPKDPSVWPVVPKMLLCLAIALVTIAGAWYLYLNNFEEELQTERDSEVTLRADYEKKLLKAVSLEGLKKQREQVQQYVTQLEKQLPNKAEMAALLSDINQAGLGRSLQFELFKPGSESVKDYYAELPIAVKISGGFHDMGMFASDIAHLSRIVTLNNIAIAPKGAGGALTLDATARTYRYLDPEEVVAKNKSANTKKQKGGKK